MTGIINDRRDFLSYLCEGLMAINKRGQILKLDDEGMFVVVDYFGEETYDIDINKIILNGWAIL